MCLSKAVADARVIPAQGFALLFIDFDGFKAINGLSLDIAPGELRCIIGPNGAGKTTMMDIITGKTRPDEGTVFFGSTIDLLRYKEAEIAQMGIGRKFQKPTVFEHLSVFENLELALAADRGVRSGASTMLVFFGDAEDRAAEAERLKHLHRDVHGSGKDSFGDVRYSALSPDLWKWIGVSGLLVPIRSFTAATGIRLRDAEREAAYRMLVAAFALRPRPIYVFNAAQAYRRAGRPREAIAAYQRFLTLAPDAPQVSEANGHIKNMEQLLAAYPNDVRIVPKYMVIHGPPAMPSGLAMCAAGKQGKAHEMQSALWSGIWPQGPGNANRDKATAEAVEASAATIAGLNVEQFKADMNGPECQTWLQQSGRTLQKFGVGGTPSFFVNGKPAQAGDLDSFKKLVEAEIAAVNKSGIAAGEYYEKAIIAKGQKEAVMISPFDD